MKLGLFGYGNIGRGVYKVAQNLDISYDCVIKKVFDLPIKKAELGDKLVTNIDDIINDPEIGAVVEVLGGHDLPYEVITRCLKAGRVLLQQIKRLYQCI